MTSKELPEIFQQMLHKSRMPPRRQFRSLCHFSNIVKYVHNNFVLCSCLQKIMTNELKILSIFDKQFQINPTNTKVCFQIEGDAKSNILSSVKSLKLVWVQLLIQFFKKTFENYASSQTIKSFWMTCDVFWWEMKAKEK